MLHVIDGLGLGGAERMLVDIANRTVADGHRVSVCVTRYNVSRAPELDQRIRLVVLNRRTRVSPRELLRLARFIRSEHVDVIHVHMKSSFAFMLQLRVPGAIRTPIVLHDHGFTLRANDAVELDTSVPAWFRIGRHFLAHHVGVYDQLTAWARRAGMTTAQTSMIPNAIDVERFSSAPASRIRDELGLGNQTLAVMVATLRREKGFDVLLDAVAKLESRDAVRIAIVGADGEPAFAAQCKARCSELGLDRTITFVGGRTDVPNVLAAADIGLLTSHTESGPLALIEYLAAGLPIVSTRVGDIGHRLAACGVPGFVEPGDVAAYARELGAVLALTPAERRARGELGRKILVESWDIRSVMPRWYAVYRAAIGN